MLRIKFERYWNDYHRKDDVKPFDDFSDLENWLFSQMQQDYTKEPYAMCFPTPAAAKRIHADGPWCIEIQPKYGEEQIWIHQIESSEGIIFSDGRFTAGKKHWTTEVQDWLVHCEQRRKNPQFNFVGSDEPPKRDLWLRLGATISITAEEEAAIFGEDENLAAQTLCQIIKKGRFVPHGDCYIPDPMVEQFNEEYGTNHTVQDVNFEM